MGIKQACDRYVHSEPDEGFKFQFSDDKCCNEWCKQWKLVAENKKNVSKAIADSLLAVCREKAKFIKWKIWSKWFVQLLKELTGCLDLCTSLFVRGTTSCSDKEHNAEKLGWGVVGFGFFFRRKHKQFLRCCILFLKFLSPCCQTSGPMHSAARCMHPVQGRPESFLWSLLLQCSKLLSSFSAVRGEGMAESAWSVVGAAPSGMAVGLLAPLVLCVLQPHHLCR